MCILLYLKLIWCSGVPEIYSWLEEGRISDLGRCAFFYMWNLFGVVLFQRSMINWRRGYISPRYVSILLYLKLIWCSGVPEIYSWLEEEGICDLGRCTFFYIWNLFSAVVFYRSMVNWRRGYILPRYVCILLYVKLIQCSGVPEICCWFEEGDTSYLGMCAFFYMWNLFSVVVFHRSIVNWRRGYISPR